LRISVDMASLRAPAASPAPNAATAAPGLWRASWAIAKKELNIYFTTPLAYVLLAFFLFVMGYFFVVNVSRYLEFTRNAQAMAQYNPQAIDQLNFTDVIFSPLLFNAALIFVFVLPFLTMRLVAEESEHPFTHSYWQNRFGFGVGNRLNGYAMYLIDSATYTARAERLKVREQDAVRRFNAAWVEAHSDK
jgi:signal transduction histidine kinase